MMVTILAFLLTLGVLIVVHEWGHYRVAKACGVKVLRFSVGFGRVIWRRQSGPDATEFTLSALPLGGYVRMLDEREGPVAPHERAQAFNNKPLRQRAAIVAAGPVANFLLAIALFAAVNLMGVDEPKPVLGAPLAGSLAERAGMRVGDWVQATSRDGQDWTELQSLPELRWQLTQVLSDGGKLHLSVSDAQGHGRRVLVLDTEALRGRELDAQLMREVGLGGAFSEPVLGELVAGGAGAQAGLQRGDRVLSVDGRPAGDAAALRELIRASAQGVEGERAPAMQWQVERAGQVLVLEVRPRIVNDAGQRLGRIEAMLGSAPELVTVSHGPLDSLWLGAKRTWDVSTLTLTTFGRMLIGEASLKNLSGPITIADYAGQSAKLGLTQYLSFLALVSVSLGVLNLLPLPMLDGGHLMYYLFEGLSGRPVSEWWLRQLQRAGVLVMLLMMTLALSNDMARLLGLH
ncbi:RIP metalloprotease RseP [Roseateles cavernae]|uniref:RIP metalloprotease RseP n=1 Tax=Roseateles cavernae TaxID=3153578 RepID=UPI0032E524A5